MKKTLLASLLAFTAVAAQAQYNGPYDGKVIFNGEVIDQTCVVVTGKQQQTVTLEKVQDTKLKAAGDVAGGKAFSIDLQNCKTTSPHQLVRAEFRMSGLVDAANHYTLKNQGGSATNVNLRLLDANGTPIEIGNANYMVGNVAYPTDNAYKNLNGQATGSINYSVEYYATGKATPGTVMSEVEYSIVYK